MKALISLVTLVIAVVVSASPQLNSFANRKSLRNTYLLSQSPGRCAVKRAPNLPKFERADMPVPYCVKREKGEDCTQCFVHACEPEPCNPIARLFGQCSEKRKCSFDGPLFLEQDKDCFTNRMQAVSRAWFAKPEIPSSFFALCFWFRSTIRIRRVVADGREPHNFRSQTVWSHILNVVRNK